MKRNISILVLLVIYATGNAQELFVYTEPASNMPAKSISAKIGAEFDKSLHHNYRVDQRYAPEIMFGVSKKWMLHLSGTFSNMYTQGIQWESVKIYAKYRFFSNDDVHKHFRMAVYGQVSHSQNPVYYDELNLNGDQSGVQAGVVATQLLNKLALSSTVSYLYVTSQRPKYNVDAYPYQAFNYTASAGYLLFPFSYTNYNQVNMNLYTELLGQETLDNRHYFVDLAPALQFIFNSNAKFDIGYRFELNGDMDRMAKNRLVTSFEYVFLNALKKKVRN
jgi:hypothetical protein